MNADTKRISWIKWIVGSIIAMIGAGGGGVAVWQYLDAKQAAAAREYGRALAEWEAFSPRPIGKNDKVELLWGWHMDLDTGLVAMSLIGPKWDLRSDLEITRSKDGRKATGTKSEGLEANENVKWANIGVIDFDSVGYRDIRDAEFQSQRAGRGDKFIYRSHPTAAPGPGHIFAIKTSDGNVAKLQIVGYAPHSSYSRKMFVRYEVYPVVADLPRPRRP